MESGVKMTCNCITAMDKELEAHNSRVGVAFTYGQGRRPDVRVHISTEKINPRNRNKMGLVATFCPFCGAVYEDSTF
jgi:hypothetical protein